jgi:uncharacterized membrane protein SpoIIM required for sporulation
MQETEFIGQNKDKWQEFEELLGKKNKDPDRLTNLFIETTDDLSYSQTYYGNRSIRVYLNRVAQQVYQAIYKNKSKPTNRRAAYWFKELPEALWHARTSLLVAFLVFTGGLAIGIFSSVHYPEFARIILGDSYIEMTEANIATGDPMAVYQDEDALDMFFRIALNNIRVGFFAFILGLTFAIGTYYILLYNGIMVGAFVYFFIERGLFRESFLAIMLHGTLELSMIVLSGAAGLVLARGLLFPGTYTRTQALVHSARSGIKIMLAVAIFLVYAAIIESFATRFTRLEGIENGQLILDSVRLLVILISAGIVVGYFVIYPRVLYRKGVITAPVMEELPPTPPSAIPIDTIKSSGRMFTESFLLFGKLARPSAILACVLSLLFVAGYAAICQGKFNTLFEWEISGIDFNPLGPFWVWDNFRFHLNFNKYPLAFPLAIGLFAIWLFFLARTFVGHVQPQRKPLGYHHLLSAILISVLAGLPLLLDQGWTVLIELFWFPVCMFFYMVSVINDSIFPASLGKCTRLMGGAFWKTVGLALLILSIQWLILMVLYSDFAWIGLEFIQMNLSRFSWLSKQLPYVMYTFLIAFIPLMAFSLTLFGMGLHVFSQQETNEARELKCSISSIGYKRRAYGLEKE